MSDQFSHENGRTTRKVSAPPGGSSSVSFGDAPKSPAPNEITKDQKPAEESIEDPAVEPAAVPVSEDSVDTLKLKVMQRISAMRSHDPAVRSALEDIVQKLDLLGCTVPPTVEADEALQSLKAALKERGSHGIIGIQRKFRSMDDDNDKKLSFDEFKKALKEMCVAPSEPDIHKLFRYFDADCSGYLSFDEFLIGLRGDMNSRRKQMVLLAFNILDKDKSGSVTIEDIENRYDASQHPDVKLGVKDAKEVLLEFMETFEAYGGGVKGDGVVTLEEFNRYYGSVSASIDDDDYFELVIRNAWHISGGEGWCANTTCKRVLVLHDDGSQSVQEVKDDFDINVKDVDTVKKVLIEQGVKNIKAVALHYMPGALPSELSPVSPAPATPSSASSASDNRKHQMRSSIMFG